MILTVEAIDRYLCSLSEKGYSERTIPAYRSDLTGLLNWLSATGRDPKGWRGFEAATAAYLTSHRTCWKPRTTLRRAATFKSFANHHGKTILANYRMPTPAVAQAHPLADGATAILTLISATGRGKD